MINAFGHVKTFHLLYRNGIKKDYTNVSEQMEIFKYCSMKK